MSYELQAAKAAHLLMTAHGDSRHVAERFVAQCSAEEVEQLSIVSDCVAVASRTEALFNAAIVGALLTKLPVDLLACRSLGDVLSQLLDQISNRVAADEAAKNAPVSPTE